jgi:glycerol-3-phosphate acyltransferase PlsX
MRIVLDAMGSDNYPDPEIEAALEAKVLIGEKVILVGQEELLKPKLEALGGLDMVQIVHAPEVLKMTDKPSRTARRKAENSMAVGMELLKSGEADGFVTAGNTGGAMANALFRLSRIPGVKRPALIALIPVEGGRAAMLDLGANTECKPEFLVQFAIMGSLYVEKLRGVNNPRVALLSNGEEAGKGNQLVKDTYPLMETLGLNFIGNAEPKEFYTGQVDVAITDGFTGNIFVKTSESVSKFLFTLLKDELTSSLRTTLGAGLAKPAFETIRKLMDPGEVGALPLLGIDGLVFVAHGRSDARALVNGIKACRQAVEVDLLGALRTAIQERLETIRVRDAS